MVTVDREEIVEAIGNIRSDIYRVMGDDVAKKLCPPYALQAMRHAIEQLALANAIILGEV